MPLYLCQPGRDRPEPWRHGASVYARPTASHHAVGTMIIRKLRNGEIVLVDDVCKCADDGRHWLRLRWPGRKGGFAGYLPVEQDDEDEANDDGAGEEEEGADVDREASSADAVNDGKWCRLL